jgi:enoyl-CoA hydratase/carnithine racemase
MLLHCDLVCGTPDVKLSTPFVDMGLVPEAGSTLLFPTYIGLQRASALLLLGKTLDAEARRLMRANKTQLDAHMAEEGEAFGRERHGKHLALSLRNVSRLSNWRLHGKQGSTAFKQKRNGWSRRQKSSNSRRCVFAAKK